MPGQAESEGLATPTTYFLKGGGPPEILGKGGANGGLGSYQPGPLQNTYSGEGSSLYNKYKETVDGLYER